MQLIYEREIIAPFPNAIFLDPQEMKSCFGQLGIDLSGKLYTPLLTLKEFGEDWAGRELAMAGPR